MTKAYLAFGKRAFDVVTASILLLVLAPILLVVAVAVRIRLGRPILFRQQRPGLGGRIFTLLKFRSMTSEADSSGEALPDAQRLTQFGKRLRRWSLDELPELWNVLCGEMSLVGPRPLLVEYLDRYSSEQARRHEVRPGITGLAQVKGRNALSWPERFELDVRYVDHVSLGLDLRILLATVKMLASGAGVSAAGHATSSRFRGASGDQP